jgi:hypothetical protein
MHAEHLKACKVIRTAERRFGCIVSVCLNVLHSHAGSVTSLTHCPTACRLAMLGARMLCVVDGLHAVSGMLSGALSQDPCRYML